jgi:phosphohistidine phosphatase SixA
MMRLTLLRHATAVESDKWSGTDADRPLTNAGIAAAEMTLKATRQSIKAVEIWTSPTVRTRQTAELASTIWKLPIRETEWLAPSALATAERAARLQLHTDVVLIGHDPDLSDLIRFLCGARVELKKSGIAILKGNPRQGEMVLRGLFCPKHINKFTTA